VIDSDSVTGIKNMVEETFRAARGGANSSWDYRSAFAGPTSGTTVFYSMTTTVVVEAKSSHYFSASIRALELAVTKGFRA
jgi:hypothetical protein